MGRISTSSRQGTERLETRDFSCQRGGDVGMHVGASDLALSLPNQPNQPFLNYQLHTDALVQATFKNLLNKLLSRTLISQRKTHPEHN
jgi:hypothetical protein